MERASWRPPCSKRTILSKGIYMDQATAKPSDSCSRLELAARLFKEYHTACFWHMKPDLVITETMIPTIVKGLRTYGGRQGVLAAARLLN
jgi:hypothetical protein